MAESETTEPSRSRPALVVVTGHGRAPQGEQGRGEGRGAGPVSFDRR